MSKPSNSGSDTPSTPAPSGTSQGQSPGGVLWDIVTAPIQIVGDIGKASIGEGSKK